MGEVSEYAEEASSIKRYQQYRTGALPGTDVNMLKRLVV